MHIFIGKTIHRPQMIHGHKTHKGVTNLEHLKNMLQNMEITQTHKSGSLPKRKKIAI